MISAFANSWKIPELRDRILFTLALIVIIRLGVHITLPGVDAGVIKAYLDSLKNADPKNPAGGITALLTVFSGGGLQQAGIFALGIMPYISASIMVQLMTAVVPKLSRLAREDGGRQKITQYTRYITIGIAMVQGFFVAKSLTSPENIPYMKGISQFGELVPDPSALWMLLTVLTIVAGTVLLMWIGDQMTEKGIGNGTSIIITVNIISALPGALIQAWNYFVPSAGRQCLQLDLDGRDDRPAARRDRRHHRDHPSPAENRGPIRQARRRTQTVRWPDAVSAAQGQLRRCHADHFRLRGALAASADASVYPRNRWKPWAMWAL